MSELRLSVAHSFLIFLLSLVSHLALRWVTLVLKGQMTARNLSHEMAERVITLDTMHSTDNIMVRLMVMDIIMVRAC